MDTNLSLHWHYTVAPRSNNGSRPECPPIKAWHRQLGRSLPSDAKFIKLSRRIDCNYSISKQKKNAYKKIVTVPLKEPVSTLMHCPWY